MTPAEQTERNTRLVTELVDAVEAWAMEVYGSDIGTPEARRATEERIKEAAAKAAYKRKLVEDRLADLARAEMERDTVRRELQALQQQMPWQAVAS